MSSESPENNAGATRLSRDRKIGIVVALVAFLGACWLLFNWNASREISAAKAEWNASEPSLKFGEKPQDSPVVPDDKNILRAQVFRDWNQSAPGVSANPAWEKWARHIEASDKETDPFTCDLDRLFRPVPGKAGAPDKPAVLADIPGQSREAALITALEHDLPELKTIPAEFASRPELSLGFHYTTARALWNAWSPFFRPLRNSSMVISPYAVAQARAGDPRVAAQVVLTALRYENALLSAYTDRCSALAIRHLRQTALQPLYAGLIRRAWSEAELSELQGALGRLDFPGMACRNSANGLVMMIDMLENIPETIDIQRLSTTDERIQAACFYATPRGLFDLHHAQAVRSRLNLLRDGIRPDGTVDLAVFKAHSAATPSGDMPWHFAAQFGQTSPRFIMNAARAQTFRHCALLGCAIERHRLAAGKLPETLAEIPSGILKSIPLGTTKAKPPTYASSPDGGYTLTYRGEDVCDDSGNEKATPGDVVWTMPARRD